MATNQTIQFKDPQSVVAWLDAAFRSEQEKYKLFPVVADVVPGHEAATGWGYVVAGYFLIEEALKALLYLRRIQVPQTHTLTLLFNLLNFDDQEILRQYYSDYQATISGNRAKFPFATLDVFLDNLDGDQVGKGGNRIGSFDWRYFPIEENRSQDMPLISIDYLHEVAYGCIQLAMSIHFGNFNPREFTHSLRMYRQRGEKYNAWLTKRLASESLSELPDRWEILWGPDYLGRYDLIEFVGGVGTPLFTVLPENTSLPIVDKRKEVADFDVQH